MRNSLLTLTEIVKLNTREMVCKKCPNFGKSFCPDFSHLWVKFLIPRVVHDFISKCHDSKITPMP